MRYAGRKKKKKKSAGTTIRKEPQMKRAARIMESPLKLVKSREWEMERGMEGREKMFAFSFRHLFQGMRESGKGNSDHVSDLKHKLTKLEIWMGCKARWIVARGRREGDVVNVNAGSRVWRPGAAVLPLIYRRASLSLSLVSVEHFSLLFLCPRFPTHSHAAHAHTHDTHHSHCLPRSL